MYTHQRSLVAEAIREAMEREEKRCSVPFEACDKLCRELADRGYGVVPFVDNRTRQGETRIFWE